MNWRGNFCFIFVLTSVFANADVQPKEHAYLNYTTVYFEEAPWSQCKSAELLVYADSLYQNQVPRYKATNSISSFKITNLDWGKEYFWKVKYYDSNGQFLGTSAMHHFSVMAIQYQNLEEQRLRVRINDTIKNAGGFLAIDYTRCVFDRTGKPVWTIPTKDTLMDSKIQVRDLRMTDENTFTFLTGKAPLEIDWEGNVLWKAPWPYIKDGDTIIYHHDFQKTKGGTYMVMGLKKVYRPIFGEFSNEQLKSADVKQIDGKWFQRTQINVMLEFDKRGKLIWFWDSGKYITNEEFNFKKTPNGIPNFATHANAFGISADQKVIYIGYRDMSRIMKVDKKTGDVIKAFGEKYQGSRSKFVDVNFRKQHGAFISTHQSIFIFNNNNIGPLEKSVSTVLEIDDREVGETSPVLWRFDLNFDTLTLGKGVSGGNVIELPNSNLLVCAGTLNRVFEVTRNKEIVWDAFVESRRKGEQWQAAPQYRTSFKKEFQFSRAYASIKRNVTMKKLELVVINSGDKHEMFQVEVMHNGKLQRRMVSASLAPGEKWAFELEEKKVGLQNQVQVRLMSTDKIIYPYEVTN
jgi:uncharacterized protein (DUF1330 family)